MIYNLFISHSWTYDDQYDRLIRLLDSAPNFEYRNYSVQYDYQLKEAIGRKIQPTSCVIIIAGVYSTYSKWINIELELACKMGKRIIAVEPWGAERTSSVVKKYADRVVKWQASSIINAIRES